MAIVHGDSVLSLAIIVIAGRAGVIFIPTETIELGSYGGLKTPSMKQLR